jgi:hypothetical protein
MQQQDFSPQILVLDQVSGHNYLQEHVLADGCLQENWK